MGKVTGEFNRKFFFKGKRVSEKNYKKRLKQREFAKNIRCNYASKTVCNLKSVTKSTKIEGRRIVNVETLAKQLICRKCE